MARPPRRPSRDLGGESVATIEPAKLAVASTLCCLVLAAAPPASAQTSAGVPAGSEARAPSKELSLAECLDLALELNHHRPASRAAVAAAEAQLRQSLAAYWPQVGLKGGFQRLDEPPNFVFPPSMMFIPPQTVTVTIPANVFGPGFPPVDVPLPIDTPGQAFSIPPRTSSSWIGTSSRPPWTPSGS